MHGLRSQGSGCIKLGHAGVAPGELDASEFRIQGNLVKGEYELL